MPPRAKRNPVKRRVKMVGLARRRLMFNPQPHFTETFSYGTLLPNAGFLLTANVDNIPQLAQYSGLYQQYRITKCKFIIMPTWTGGENQNAAIYNSVSGGFPATTGVSSAGTSRVVTVIDSSPGQSVPVSEAAVLQENGCRIRFLDKKMEVSCAPVPDLKDANGNQLTIRGKFMNFASPNVAHYGVRGWITHPYTVGGGSFNVANAIEYIVYAKLTFGLREPR